MQQTRERTVRGPKGFHGTLDPGAESEDGRQLVILPDGGELWVRPDMLFPQPDGSYRLEVDPERLKRVLGRDLPGEDADGPHPAGSEDAVSGAAPLEEEAIPVVEETMHLRKRTVETGRVQVRKRVYEREEVVDEPVYQEVVDVQRVPVNRFVDTPVETRTEGDTTIIPLLEEVLVVEKRLLLREEVHVTRRRVEQRDPQRVTLRSEEVEVERERPSPTDS